MELAFAARSQSAEKYGEYSEAIVERSVGPLKLYRSPARDRAIACRGFACQGSNLWRSRNALEDLTLVAPRSDLPRANPGECALSYAHFSVAPISLNTTATFPPTNVTAVMINTAIRLAIRAYSIAVTPDSSLKKLRTRSMGFS